MRESTGEELRVLLLLLDQECERSGVGGIPGTIRAREQALTVPAFAQLESLERTDECTAGRVGKVTRGIPFDLRLDLGSAS